MIRVLLSPKVVIPLVLGAALIFALVGISDAGRIASIMQQLKPQYAAGFIALMIAYEAIRGLQWHVLLRGLAVRAPLAAEIFSFLFGEATKTAPIGNYFQNYLLSRIEGEDFGRTSAATTLTVLTEVAWGLIALVIVGIDGWTWLRPLILIGLAVFMGVVAVVARVERHADAPDWMHRNSVLRTVLDELARFRRGVITLLSPRPLSSEAILCACYLVAAGAAMYVLALGIGINQLSFWQMLGIYAFSLTAGLILPLPVDLGVVELTGVGALVASGVGREEAVSLMLLNRLLTVGTALAVAAVGTLFLREELKLALSRAPHSYAKSGQG